MGCKRGTESGSHLYTPFEFTGRHQPQITFSCAYYKLIKTNPYLKSTTLHMCC